MSSKTVDSNGGTNFVRKRRAKSHSDCTYRRKNPTIDPKIVSRSASPLKEKCINYILMGNRNNKVSEFSNEKDKGLYLTSYKVLDIIGYFNYSSIISHGLDDYFHGIIRGKLDGDSVISYDSVLTYFSWFIFLRNFLLGFIENHEIRTLLGETERIRPERQLIMVCTMYGIYFAIVFLILENSTKLKYFSWLSPFQILRGQTATKAYGLNTKMAEDWHHYTLVKWRKYLTFGLIRCAFSIVLIIWVTTERWKTSTQLFKMMQVLWTTLMAFWMFFASNLMYICYVYFRSLCYYFRQRYAKVNEDIESIITGTKRLKSSERTETLHHILVEHNELCLKISEYNLFWAKWLMSTYFFLMMVLCFTLFQSLFTTNPLMVRILMFCIALESAYFLTTITISAALLSNTAHSSYRRLIRVTFDKYPVELQIQLRMFIQRLSGPTIGFYCLDLFEITYTTYASIVAALGQNFLLIVDFVRSYAEVGKEEDDFPNVLTHLTETVFNTTLSAIGFATFTESTGLITYQNTNI